VQLPRNTSDPARRRGSTDCATEAAPHRPGTVRRPPSHPSWLACYCVRGPGAPRSGGSGRGSFERAGSLGWCGGCGRSGCPSARRCCSTQTPRSSSSRTRCGAHPCTDRLCIDAWCRIFAGVACPLHAPCMSLACPLHVCYEQRAALSPSLCQPAPLRRKGGTRRVRLVRGGAEASGGRVPPERTLIVGQSLGGALAVLAAASRAGCAAASCRSFARLSDVVALHGGTIVRGIFPLPWPFPPLARFACGLLAKVPPAPGVAAGGAAPRAPGLSARAAAAVGRGLGA